MGKKIYVTSKAPAPVGPYSQAVEVNGFLYCSGQVPINPETNEVLKGDVVEQTHLVMSNVKAVLSEAGLNFGNVVKTTIFLKDMGDFAKVNEVYAGCFETEPPARSCVEVSRLPKDVDVEVEVLAFRG